MRDLFNPDQRSTLWWVLVGLTLIGLISLVDYLIGYRLTTILFPFLYLLPIALVTWFAGRQAGLIATAASTLAWLLSHSAAGLFSAQPAIHYWHVTVGTGLYGSVAFLLSALKSEKALARTDPLTGAVNRRFFYEVVQRELDRAQRYPHPLTMAYLDLDNFKAINDRFGHPTGDQVLRTVVATAHQQLRRTDVMARLNGDEFAFLLLETDQPAAHSAVTKIQAALLQAMQQHAWPVTFSTGVLTCLAPPPTVDQLIQLVDEVMYAVKTGGKNAIQYALFPPPSGDGN